MKKIFLLIMMIIAVIPANYIFCAKVWFWEFKNTVLIAKFSPDEKFVYVFTDNGVEKHSAYNGSLISNFDSKIKNIYGACISANCSKGVCIFNDSIAFWDFEKENIQYKIKTDELAPGLKVLYNVENIDLSPDGKYAYITNVEKLDSSNIIVYNINERRVEKIINHIGKLIQIKASPDGKYLLTQTFIQKANSYVIYICDVANIQIINEIDRSTIGMNYFRFSYDGKMLAYNKYNNIYSGHTFYNIELKSLSEIKSSYQPATKRAYCFSRDNKFLFIGNDDNGKGFTQIWSLSNGKELNDIPYMDAACYDLSKDDKSLLIGGSHLFFSSGGGKPYVAPRLELITTELDLFAIKESEPEPRPYTFQMADKKLSIIPSGTCNLVKAEIANSSGKVLITKSLATEQGTALIDISSLSSGAYFCRIICGGNVFTEKFVVVK